MNPRQLLKPLLAAAALYSTCLSAGAQTYQWANRMGGTGYDHVTSTAFDATGNVYVTGSFEGTVDFDPGAGTANLTAVGAHDIFIAKYSAGGAYMWASSIGGSSVPTAWSEGLKIAIDVSGKVIVAGYFTGTADFDPGPGTANRTATQYNDLFVAQYDAAGKFLWVNTTGGWSAASALTLDLSGNIYISGTIMGVSDFDPSANVANLNTTAGTLFIAKYNSSGAYLWAKNMAPTTGSLSATGMGLDIRGNIYLTGSFNGTLNFNPGGVTNLVPVGVQDVYLAKYDPSGNLKWAENMGCLANATIPKGLVVNPLTGSVYITGNHYTTIDLDPGPGTATFTTNGNYNVFLAKYDSTGAYQWANSMGGAANNGGNDGSSVTLDASGNVLMGGYYTQTVDFDPGPGVATLTSTYPDIFIAKYTSAGAYVWAKSLHAAHPQIFNPGIPDAKLAVDGQGNLYVAGTFADTVDFGLGAPGATRASAGHYDAYVAKYTASSTGISPVAQAGTAVSIYPNPASGGRAAIRYDLATASDVTITVCDLTGRMVTNMPLSWQQAGNHTSILTQRLAAGMYMVMLHTSDATTITRLVVAE